MIKLLLLAFALLAVQPAFAKHTGGGSDHVSIFSTITVHEGEAAGDIACAFCTVNLQGDVKGDVAVLFGTVHADPDRSIDGDVALLFGTLVLADNAHVRGDVAVLAGTSDLAPTATIGGDRAILSSPIAIGILLAPLLILAGIIWLVVHLIRRARYGAYA